MQKPDCKWKELGTGETDSEKGHQEKLDQTKHQNKMLQN